MTGGIHHVYAYEVQSFGRGVGYMFYVKSNTRRGGYAMNLNLDTVRADHTGGAWAFAQMDYNGQTGQYPPTFGDWHLTRATGDSDAQVMHLSGLPRDPIQGLEVRDSVFTNARTPATIYSNVTGLELVNVTINGAQATR